MLDFLESLPSDYLQYSRFSTTCVHYFRKKNAYFGIKLSMELILFALKLSLTPQGWGIQPRRLCVIPDTEETPQVEKPEGGVFADVLRLAEQPLVDGVKVLMSPLNGNSAINKRWLSLIMT